MKNSLKSLLHAISNFFAVFPPFAQSQLNKQELGNKVGAEERPRTASERYGKIVISLPFTLSRNPYFVLRETKVHDTNSLSFICFISLFI